MVLIAQQPGPASEPLAFTRPGGCNTRGYLSQSATLKHSFVFNRVPALSDLGNISPGKPDAFDATNYHFRRNLFFSRHSPRFVLADIDKIDETSVTAMIGLELCFAMRTQLHGKPISVYLMGDHTWALWAWAEAAAREELAPRNNVIDHVDDHEDIGLTQRTMELARRNIELDLTNANHIIDEYACTAGDPTGIGSFIGPAAATNFLGAYFWIYGRGPAAPATDSHVYQGSIKDLFQHGAYRYRYHCFPFLEAKEICSPFASGKRIYDFDVDVAGKVDSIKAVARRHLNRRNWIDCMTIAISPQYGPKLNHVRKVMALLGMLKRRR